jgi:hypothetical protein
LSGARRAIAAVRLLARDGRIPRPLRWLVVVGLLPVPGPFDEAVLLVAAALLFAFYRESMRDAWRAAGAQGRPDDASPE